MYWSDIINRESCEKKAKKQLKVRFSEFQTIAEHARWLINLKFNLKFATGREVEKLKKFFLCLFFFPFQFTSKKSRKYHWVIDSTRFKIHPALVYQSSVVREKEILPATSETVNITWCFRKTWITKIDCLRDEDDNSNNFVPFSYHIVIINISNQHPTALQSLSTFPPVCYFF